MTKGESINYLLYIFTDYEYESYIDIYVALHPEMYGVLNNRYNFICYLVDKLYKEYDIEFNKEFLEKTFLKFLKSLDLEYNK